MGLFTKSLLVLLLAVSTPLVYRQFVNDGHVKYLSSHITNYKIVDQFLRQSANRLEDLTKQYVNKNTAGNIQKAVDTHVRPHVEPIIKSMPDYVNAVQIKIKSLVKQAVEVVNAQIGSTTGSPQAEQKRKPEKASTKAPVINKKSVEDKLKRAAEQASKLKRPKASTQEQQSHRIVNCPKDKTSGDKTSPTRLWTKAEIEKFKTSEILLAFMGLVYNVTSGAQSYYGPGKEYSIFAGRDATRAYLTGNFTHDLSDDISDLDENTYGDLNNWSALYKSSYPLVGRLNGVYYDSEGCPTAETKRNYKALEKLSRKTEERRETDVMLPECNSEWNGDTKKSRVWCSKASGGIERNWVGVPRIYKDEASGSDRCVCYGKESQVGATLAHNLKIYPNCEPNSFECNL